MKKKDNLSVGVAERAAVDRTRRLEVARRQFLKLTGAVGAGIATGVLHATLAEPRLAHAAPLEYRNYRPEIMGYRRLGKTDMMVSAISMGGAGNYGTPPMVNDDPAGFLAMLDRLLELGVNFFDTCCCPAVSGYDTEQYYAQLCTPANRDRVFLSTKVDDVSPAGTRASLETSLSIMGTDHVDVLYIHNGAGVEGSDYSAALACLDTMDELIDEGKIRFKGITAHSVDILSGLLDLAGDRIDVIMGFQCPMNDWGAFASGTVELWNELWTQAATLDVGTVAMKVLAGAMEAWATRESNYQADVDAWSRLEPFVDDGATVAQAAIRWALTNPEISTAVVGMRSMEEVEENCAAVTPDGPVGPGGAGGMGGQGVAGGAVGGSGGVAPLGGGPAGVPSFEGSDGGCRVSAGRPASGTLGAVAAGVAAGLLLRREGTRGGRGDRG